MSLVSWTGEAVGGEMVILVGAPGALALHDGVPHSQALGVRESEGNGNEV